MLSHLTNEQNLQVFHMSVSIEGHLTRTSFCTLMQHDELNKMTPKIYLVVSALIIKAK